MPDPTKPSNPYEDKNPYDVVEELRFIVADLKSVVYGNPNLRTLGLLNELDSLRRDVRWIGRYIAITWVTFAVILIAVALWRGWFTGG
jgi:hypothetical protein